MKPCVFASVLAAAVMTAQVSGHGQMLTPDYRPVTTWYRENSGALTNAGDSELEWAPIENLAGRSQSDFPEGATWKLYNGCRGMIYESTNNVTTLVAGEEFTVTYYIQAPHPGYMNLSVVKPETDSTGTITYVKDTTIANYDDFAESGGTFSLTATMPSTVTGCDDAGDCALQFYWHSDTANQTYPTCADIIVTGGSGSASVSTTTTTASSTASSAASTTEESTAASSAASATEESTAASSAASATEETTTTTTSSAASATEESTAASSAADETTTTTTSTTASSAASEETDDTTTTSASTAAEAEDTTTTTSASTAGEATDDTTTATTDGSSKCSVRRRRRN